MNELKEYYILYFDVLGYQNKIKMDEVAFLEDIKELFRRSTEKNRDITMRTFSDNMLACTLLNQPSGLKYLSRYAARIQELMLRNNGLLLRGAITKGTLYLDERFVYGNGLVRAVNLEEKNAIYPRIIIDVEKLQNESYIKTSKHTISTDTDGHKFIDFLNYYDPKINKNGERNKNWDKLSVSVNNCIYDLHNSSVDSIKEKGIWLKNYFNNTKKKFNMI